MIGKGNGSSKMIQSLQSANAVREGIFFLAAQRISVYGARRHSSLSNFPMSNLLPFQPKTFGSIFGIASVAFRKLAWEARGKGKAKKEA
jgi:hypothetical protein